MNLVGICNPANFTKTISSMTELVTDKSHNTLELNFKEAQRVATILKIENNFLADQPLNEILLQMLFKNGAFVSQIQDFAEQIGEMEEP